MLAKALQKAKSVVGQVTGGSSGDAVSTSVSCSVTQTGADASQGAGGALGQTGSANAGQTGTTGGGAAQEFLITFSVTGTNKAGMDLTGITIAQNPAPAGFRLDATTSSKECVMGAGNSVGCIAAYKNGESKTFTVAYKTSDPAACETASALTKPASVSSLVTGTVKEDKFSASISCSSKQIGGPVDGVAGGVGGGAGGGSGGASSGGGGGAGFVASSAGLLKPGESMLTRYTLSVANVSGVAQNRVRISHGTLPAGANFDAAHSSPDCKIVGQEVQCSVSLKSGETRSLHIAYTVQNPATCVAEAGLKNVRSVTDVAGASLSGKITVTVQCSIEVVGGEKERSLHSKGTRANMIAGATSALPKTGANDAYYSTPGKSTWTLLAPPREVGLAKIPYVSISLASTLFVFLIFSSIFLIQKRKGRILEQ
jgi:hypothetical protein